MDCALIAMEVVHTLVVKKERAIMLKIDFHKAFDSLSWDFLYSIMKCMGFNSIWIIWINECLSTAWVSVLVNGSSSETFKLERRIRQRDPLSPFLFLLAIEGLKCLPNKALSQGIIAGIYLSYFISRLLLLQFADDTLIFLPANLEMVRSLRRVLRCFQLISGLKIN